jgi:SAM-dependent methyltransferase
MNDRAEKATNLMDMNAHDVEDLSRFEARLRSLGPSLADIVPRNRERFGAPWASAFLADVRRAFGDGWDDPIRGYVGFTRDALYHQLYFEKHRRYKNARFAEVKRELLDDEAHMLREYLPGMFLSSYLWPQHWRLARVYLERLAPRIAARAPASFVEVGTGSAMYTIHTLRALPGILGRGFDLSPHSVTFGNRMLAAFGLDERCAIELGDGLGGAEASCDLVVSHEVLEHLEDPSAFVAGLHRLLVPGGAGFITAAITAGHSDHIYLFRDPAEVEALLRDAGFTILDTHLELAYEGRPVEVTPRIAGYLVEKA